MWPPPAKSFHFGGWLRPDQCADRMSCEETISSQVHAMNNEAESATHAAKPDLPAIELAPPDYYDPVIEFYKKDVDRTLLRENLKLTVEERLLKAHSFHKSIDAWREAGSRLRTDSETGA
jgi:hypothetical protein